MIQERSGNKKAGFLTFVFVILLVDLVIGFVYGYVREAPEKARAAHKPGPVAAQPSDSTPAVSEHHAPEQQPDETNNGHVVEDDPESINAAADAILGVGSPENDPQPQQVPQVDIYETATDDTNTQPKQADDNPEDDLYTFNSAAADTPAKLSEETRKGNE
ncbi:MAG: hypothetical protein HQ592_12815, partial [Planctomycetes bacterium]|nr:hypothetical protein [Planctomycetota bacterium]